MAKQKIVDNLAEFAEVKLKDKPKKKKSKAQMALARRKASAEALLPVVKGHKLTPKQWLAFEIYIKTSNYVAASNAAKVPKTEIAKWSQSDWWNDLFDTFIQQKQDELMGNLTNHYDKLGNAITSIWDGTIDDHRLAGTIAKTFETVAKLARGKVDPLISSKRDVNIKIEEKKEINVTFMHKVLPHLDPDQAREFALTGKIPEDVLKEIGEEIELTDYEEIEDEP